MNKVIVTGATGFIGKALTKKLLDDSKYVYAIVRSKDKIKELSHYNNLVVIEVPDNGPWDLSNKIDSNEIDVFYHLAKVGDYNQDMEDYSVQLDNLNLACNSINEAINIKCKKFVLIGSISQFKKSINSSSKDNRLCSIYGAVRQSAQIICETIAHVNKINITTVILPNCYGVGDYSSRSTNRIIQTLLEGRSPELIIGNKKYDLVYINDVVEGLGIIGEYGKNNKTYYIGHIQMKSFKEIMKEIRDIINPNVNLKFGTLEENSYIDYSLININALYNDTGFLCKSHFKDNILKTASWVKNLNL